MRTPMRNLLKPNGDRETLERLMRWPGLRKKLGDTVLIYSREHGCYWRGGGCGYTRSAAEAGRYSMDEAWSLTMHCGPEKQIQYEPLRSNTEGQIAKR